MYQPHTPYHPPHRKKGYFLPFLSIIILGLIVVLVFQIVDYFQQQHLKKLENKAAVTVLAGKADMKVWGVDQWTDAPSGSILHEGDALRTAPGSRIVMTLQNGSIVRLASETEVEVEALKTRDNQDELGLVLSSGEVWLQRAKADIVRASFTVSVPHMRIYSLGTVFDVAVEDNSESVHVLDGKVRAEVLVEDKTREGVVSMRTDSTLEVVFGQEIVIGESELAALRNSRPVDLLAVLSDRFRNSEWYAWNHSADAQKAGTVSVADAVENPISKEPLAPKKEEPAPVQLPAALDPPKILTPVGSDRITKTPRIVITGETPSNTQKLEVTTFRDGKPDAYVLQKYTAGSSRFTYVASAAYGNFTPGDNRFEFRAVSKDGAKSEPALITVRYDVPVEQADLSAPKILTINGKSFTGNSKFETEEENILMAGSLGKGIIKVVVNDFALTRFVPGNTEWSYYAKTVYGNLKDGENTFTVYGVDATGAKTRPLTFIVVKKSAPAPIAPPKQPDSVPEPSAETPPAPAPVVPPLPNYDNVPL